MLLKTTLSNADNGYVVESGLGLFIFDELPDALKFVGECYEEEIVEEKNNEDLNDDEATEEELNK